jgi:hypothetical protein
VVLLALGFDEMTADCRDEIAERIKRLRGLTVKEECRSCDCLQGYLTQLELDYPEATDLIEPLKVPREKLHGCLGCDPCPPAEAFGDYLRGLKDRDGGNCARP